MEIEELVSKHKKAGGDAEHYGYVLDKAQEVGVLDENIASALSSALRSGKVEPEHFTAGTISNALRLGMTKTELASYLAKLKEHGEKGGSTDAYARMLNILAEKELLDEKLMSFLSKSMLNYRKAGNEHEFVDYLAEHAEKRSDFGTVARNLVCRKAAGEVFSLIPKADPEYSKRNKKEIKNSITKGRKA